MILLQQEIKDIDRDKRERKDKKEGEGIGKEKGGLFVEDFEGEI